MVYCSEHGLGAWARVGHCKRILDVGTGTGLVALMAAQRSSAEVVGIDLDAEAVAQASENAQASPWSDRVRMETVDVKCFANRDSREEEPEANYHLSLVNYSTLSFATRPILRTP